MSNNNQNIDFSAKLSDMDRIFIPKDLDGNVTLEDLASYKVQIHFWRSVPENFRLVKVNRLTQKITAAEGYGLKWVIPILTKTILVPAKILEGKREYKNVNSLTKNKIDATIDFSIVMNIVDPAKYKSAGTTQLSQLDSLIKELLKVYVFTKDFETLVQEPCHLHQFDPEGKLVEYEQTFGIRVSKVIFEKVQLPEKLKKISNDKFEEEQRRKAQAVKLKAEQEKAEADARVMGILAEAEAEKIRKIEETKMDVYIKRMNQFIETLQAKGIPAEEIAEQLKLEIASKNGNAVFMSGNNNGMNNNLASSVYAGNIASENRKEAKRKTNPVTNKVYTNSERLVERMNMIELLQGPLSKSDQMLKEELSTPGNYKKERVDKFSEEEFQELIQMIQLKLNFDPQEEENSSRRTKR